ncbi:MAG: hypothetical protein JW885_02540 [Deltaproteobacteria bacterium]|nr:hypothetical protein [Candidatus Zymogenaceae bacterium]
MDHIQFLLQGVSEMEYDFTAEVKKEMERLCRSGGVGDTKLNTVLRVALENIAGRFRIIESEKENYENLQCF